MILGLIPARGGSKGVPRKNIRLVQGKPLIAYAIQCGLAVPEIDHLMVSTEDHEIGAIAKQWGAEVPFLRPEELAQDDTPMIPVLKHAILQCEELYQKKVEYLVLIDPTAPLRESADIEGALKKIREEGADALVSGSEAHRNPHFNMVRLEEGKVVLGVEGGKKVFRRQDAPPYFDLNTVVWIWKREAIVEREERIPSNSVLYLVPKERAIDMDQELDFKLLDFLLTQRRAD